MRGNQRYGRQNYNRDGFKDGNLTKAVTEMGVGHMIGKLEVITEGTIEASVMEDQG